METNINFDYWKTNTGDYIAILDMTDLHLSNVIKSLWNNLVRTDTPFGDDYVRWMYRLSKEEGTRYIYIMLNELKNRRSAFYKELAPLIFKNTTNVQP